MKSYNFHWNIFYPIPPFTDCQPHFHSTYTDANHSFTLGEQAILFLQSHFLLVFESIFLSKQWNNQQLCQKWKKHDFSILFQTKVHNFLPMFETLHILDDGIIHQFFGFGGWFSWWGVLCSKFSITESKSITEIIFHKTKLIQVRRSLDLIGSGNLHSKSKWHNNSTAQ